MLEGMFPLSWLLQIREITQLENGKKGTSLAASNVKTNIRLVKTMVFPVVMYGCESWTVKKAELEELMLLNCGVGEDS